MKIFCLAFLFVLFLFLPLVLFSEYFPQIFDPKEYRIWKKVYNDGNFRLKNKTKDPLMGTEYETYVSETLPDYNIFYYCDTEGKNGCAIFEGQKVVFSSFYKKHSKKLLEKVRETSKNI